jgi:hypothetical protein
MTGLTIKQSLALLLLAMGSTLAHAQQENKVLTAQLDSIYREDQVYRKEQQEAHKKYGFTSKEYKDLDKIIHKKDSLNQVRVRAILDTYGWLGPEEIGVQGNRTLFLVIQHSNEATQEKYIPMMREAVKKGKASGSSLALMEDRLALSQGKMQIYGSQVLRDSTGTYVDPILDVDHVDERRAQVGLPPMAEYLKYFSLSWSVEQYKKDLPASPAYRRWLALKEYLEKQKH